MIRLGWRWALAGMAVAGAGAHAQPSPQAEEWRVLAIDGAGQHGASVAYVDAATIARSGDDVRFTMLVRFQNPPPDFEYLRGRMRADCAGHRWGAEGSAWYRGDTAVRQFGAVELEPVQPGTNAAGVLESVCNARYLSEAVDPVSHSRELFGK
jgi:hypothetical protein